MLNRISNYVLPRLYYRRSEIFPESSPANETDPVPYWEQWLQNQYSDEAVSADRAWAEAQAQKQMDFQERMSNTSYQRAVADLTKAGLNPALAYSQGGASSAHGAMADSTSTTQKADIERERNMFNLLNAIILALGNITSSAIGRTRFITSTIKNIKQSKRFARARAYILLVYICTVDTIQIRCQV